MHIIHFCGALKGGPLSAIADWTRQQVSEGHRVSLIYSPLRDPVDSFRAGLAPEIDLIPLAMPREIHPVLDFRAYRQLLALLRRTKPDIVHFHSSKAGAIGRIAALQAEVPAIYSTHGMAYLRTDVIWATRAIFYAMEWVLGLAGGTTVACSQSELRSMRAMPGLKCVIPNGIDLTELGNDRGGAAHEGLQIALCGRITAQKNPRLACRIACLSPPQWRWIWLGDGDLEPLVTRGGRIEVQGWMPRSKVLARLSACDIMVHTSSWEGMPIAILEAMALGLPVVATDVVGNRDLVVDGVTGFIAQDEESFLCALEALVASPTLRRSMGEAGRRRVQEEFDQKRLFAQWMNLYRLVNGRSAQAARKPHRPYPVDGKR